MNSVRLLLLLLDEGQGLDSDLLMNQDKKGEKENSTTNLTFLMVYSDYIPIFPSYVLF